METFLKKAGAARLPAGFCHIISNNFGQSKNFMTKKRIKRQKLGGFGANFLEEKPGESDFDQGNINYIVGR